MGPGQFVQVVNSFPPYPILRELDSQANVLHAIEPIQQVFQGRHDKKTPFVAQKRSKEVNFYPKSVLCRSGWSVFATPTLSCSRWSHETILGMPLIPFEKYFWAAGTKINRFSPKNGQRKPIVTPNQCFLGLSGRLVPPPPNIQGAGAKERCFLSH